MEKLTDAILYRTDEQQEKAVVDDNELASKHEQTLNHDNNFCFKNYSTCVLKKARQNMYVFHD